MGNGGRGSSRAAMYKCYSTMYFSWHHGTSAFFMSFATIPRASWEDIGVNI